MSYSHARDHDLAPLLQREVERFATPWYRLRSCRIFRDNANLAASSTLWESIEEGLASSKWFILLASPLSASSSWVDKEVAWWLANRSSRRLIIGLTDGEFAAAEGGTSADVLPPALRALPYTEPRWVDLRPLRDAGRFGRRAPRLTDAVADLAAAVREVPKDDLVGAHLRFRRRAMRLLITGVLGLVVLLATSVVTALIAVHQRSAAQAQTMTATSRQLVAEAIQIEDAQPDLARQLLAEAYRLSPTPQVVGAVLESNKLPLVIAGQGLSRGIAFSPKRDLLAIAGDRGVKLEDPAGPRTVAELEGGPDHTMAVGFSPDDRLLVTGGSEGTIRLFDIPQAESPRLLLRTSVGSATITSVAFAPHAAVVVAYAQGGALSVLDVTDHEDPRVLSRRPGLNIPETAMAISPDGRLLATSGQDSAVDLWDFSDPAKPIVTASVAGHSNFVSALAFSADGTALASGAGDDTARLWNVSDVHHVVPYSTMAGQSLGLSALAYSPDGKTLAVGAGDGTIRLWDVGDPFRVRQQAVLPGHTSGIRALAFTGDSRYLASASADGAAGDQAIPVDNSTVRVWPVAGAARSAAMAVLPSAGRPAFSPDSKTLAAGFPTTLWELSEESRPRQLSTVPTFNQGGQTAVFSPDGRTLATGTPALLWDVGDRQKPRSITPGVRQVSGAKTAVFSPDGKLLILSGDAHPLELWSVANGTPQLVGNIPASGPTAAMVTFSPDGSLVTAATQDGLAVWSVRDPVRPGRIATIANRKLKSAAFAGDSRTLVTGDTAGVVTVWQIGPESGPKAISSSARHVGAVRSISVYPAGHLLATSDDNGTVIVWDLTDPARLSGIATLTAGGHIIGFDIAFSPDGRILAAGDESSLTLWNTDAAGILARACAVSRPITEDDWARYLPDLPFDPPCS
jgi:WD40 repeat protein